MKILFMGTPDFALVSLRVLVERGKDTVCAVVTQPDKPKGRGYTLTPPPVKVYAEEKNIPVLQPQTLRDEAFYSWLCDVSPDMICVVAYGKILPVNVLDYPKLGCVNVHGSLLPEYRGAAPMQRAILEGKKVTGITTMYMAAGMDTGDMIFRREVPIAEEDNFETVHDALAAVGADLLLETVEAVKNGTAPREAQNDALATVAPKIEKEDMKIDFSESAEAVHNRIRALSPIPLSFTRLPDGKLLKVTKSRIVSREGKNEEPGKVVSLENGEITVSCGEGKVALLGVLPEGKGRMNAADFIRGRKIAVGDMLGGSDE